MSKQKPLSSSDDRTAEYKAMMMKAAEESDRGFVITSAAVLDFYLERVIKAFLIDVAEVRALFEGAYAPFGDFSGKIKAAYVMGLITKNEADRINVIRKIRNVFAHEIHASFSHASVDSLCKRSPIDSKGEHKKAFATLAIEVGVGLIDRDVEITRDHKRKAREEPKPLSLFG